MNYRIEISPLPRWRDARGEGVRKQVKDSLGIALEGVRTRDVYTVSAAISAEERGPAAAFLTGLCFIDPYFTISTAWPQV